MITAWRLVKSKYAEHAFDGEGSRLFGGRWSSPGLPVAYCSATTSLAVLEVFANVQRSDLVAHYVIVSCTFDPSLVTAVDHASLPVHWRQSPAPAELKVIGDQWIRTAASAVLNVPSAIIDRERNYLINPLHPDFGRIRRGSPEPFTFDLRLIERS